MEKVIEFLRAVGRLKGIPRTGWVEAEIKEPESVADHCFRTVVLAMVTADIRGLNTEKALRMAILHDLAEAETGDLTPEQKDLMGSGYSREERRAMEGILSLLPKALDRKYRTLWHEYHDSSSPEAVIVKQADRLEMLLQALEYEEKGADASRLVHFWDTKIEDPILSELLRPEIEKRRGRV